MFIYMSLFSEIPEYFKKIKELSLSFSRSSKNRGFYNKVSSLFNTIFLRLCGRFNSHTFCRFRNVNRHLEVEDRWVPLVAGLRELIQRGVFAFYELSSGSLVVYISSKGIRIALQRWLRINIHVRLRRWVFWGLW